MRLCLNSDADPKVFVTDLDPVLQSDPHTNLDPDPDRNQNLIRVQTYTGIYQKIFYSNSTIFAAFYRN
jgi:hypothetical protein